MRAALLFAAVCGLLVASQAQRASDCLLRGLARPYAGDAVAPPDPFAAISTAAVSGAVASSAEAAIAPVDGSSAIATGPAATVVPPTSERRVLARPSGDRQRHEQHKGPSSRAAVARANAPKSAAFEQPDRDRQADARGSSGPNGFATAPTRAATVARDSSPSGLVPR